MADQRSNYSFPRFDIRNPDFLLLCHAWAAQQRSEMMEAVAVTRQTSGFQGAHSGSHSRTRQEVGRLSWQPAPVSSSGYAK
jgi:hypothetical protein